MHAREGYGTRGAARVRPEQSPSPLCPALPAPRPRSRGSPAGKRLAKMVSNKQIMAAAARAERRLSERRAGAGPVFKESAARPRPPTLVFDCLLQLPGCMRQGELGLGERRRCSEAVPVDHAHPRTTAAWGPEALRQPRLCPPNSLRSIHKARLTTLSAFFTPHPRRELAIVPQTQTRRDHTPGLLHLPLFAFTASARVPAEATCDGEEVASLEVTGATCWPRCFQLSPSSCLLHGPFSQIWELGQHGQKRQA